MIYRHQLEEMREEADSIYKKAENIGDKHLRYRILHHIDIIKDEIDVAFEEMKIDEI